MDKKALIALGTALAISLVNASIAKADTSLQVNAMHPAPQGNSQMTPDGQCGNGNCGTTVNKKANDGKCGNGNCSVTSTSKTNEGKCGNGTCGT